MSKKELRKQRGVPQGTVLRMARLNGRQIFLKKKN